MFIYRAIALERKVSFFYQKTVYKMVKIPKTTNAPAAKPFDTLNILASIYKPFLFSLLSGSNKLTPIITADKMRNE